MTTTLTLRSTLLVTLGVLLSKTASSQWHSVSHFIYYGMGLIYLDDEADTARRGLSCGSVAFSAPQQW